MKVPHWLPMIVAGVSESVAKITKRAPRVSLDSVRMSRHTMFFDASKAVRELGLPQTPLEEALGRAMGWFRANSYAP